ncbi:hypothetical protein A9Q81_20595 [Gammaproteobacteria bacterium 42_54_T18]|nr:hypothetical protein A9Q81_20595 [Gammaproteobacteria bacterium 42_54_T18]
MREPKTSPCQKRGVFVANTNLAGLGIIVWSRGVVIEVTHGKIAEPVVTPDDTLLIELSIRAPCHLVG